MASYNYLMQFKENTLLFKALCISSHWVQRFNTSLSICRYGSCWPTQCNTQNVTAIITKLIPEVLGYAKMMDLVSDKVVKIASKVVGLHERTLCDEPVDYHNFAWQATFVLVCFLLLLCAIGTSIESVQEYFKPDPLDIIEGSNKTHEFKMECGMTNTAFAKSQISEQLELTKLELKQLELTKCEQLGKTFGQSSSTGCEDADSTFRSPTTCQERTSCNYILDFFLCFSFLRNSRMIFCTQVRFNDTLTRESRRFNAIFCCMLQKLHLSLNVRVGWKTHLC